MEFEEQVKLYKELSRKIEELEEQKKALSLAILHKMPSKTIRLAGYQVRCCSRLSIKLSLEDARTLNAVKVEEIVDKDKIKVLYHSGQSISGVTEIHYIQISSLSSEQ